MGMTLEELGDRMSAEEFILRHMFEMMDPRGPIAEKWLSGQICATVANVAPRKKGSKPFSAEDFYFDPFSPKKKGGKTKMREYIEKIREKKGRRG
jgi:hypothetical protein